MNEHDESLQRALEENMRLRTEREERVREASSAEFAGRLRLAERFYWVYAIVCIIVGVAAINYFIRTQDTKALIGCAVIMLVVYETTVLMKLWFATASMKMSVLKDVKLLRLEVAQLASSLGGTRSSEPAEKYEPLRGTSPWERKFWIVACVVVGILVSSWTSGGLDFRDGQLSADSLVTLDSDGSATSVTEVSQTYRGAWPPGSFPFYAPKEWTVHWIDPLGQEMPTEVTPDGTHNRFEVTVPAAAVSDGKLRHTRIAEIPQAATFENGLWTYKADVMYSVDDNRIKTTVLLPPGAKIVSANPSPALQFDQDGRTALRFQAEAGRNEKFAWTIRYKLPRSEESN